MFFRQKIQMALRAFEKTFAKHAAGTQRNFGLNNMITGPQGIPLRVQESQHPVALIIMQKSPGNRHGNQTADEHHRKLPNLNPHRKENRPGGKQQHQRRSQIRL